MVARSNQRTAAIATAALVLYPFGVGLPIIEVERFGHTKASSILEGVTALFASGQWLVGAVVLACSIVLPIGKLVSLLVLSAGGLGLARRHRAVTYRVVEWTGRWGMLDVLLVALLVAVLKLGDIVEVTAGPAALAFSCVVVLSLLAAASFDPHALWEGE
jgi:paraquat-inducible protein A